MDTKVANSIPEDVPEIVRVISLWSRWAAAVYDGIKTIETRRWAWPYEPGWLAIHAAKQWDKPSMPGRLQPFPEVSRVQSGALIALVHIDGCRPLRHEDLNAALIYREGLFAWPMSRLVRLRPHIMRGPQKFSSVPRSVLIAL